MNERRLELLFKYFALLIQLEQTNYLASAEITEVINAIRTELNLNKTESAGVKK